VVTSAGEPVCRASGGTLGAGEPCAADDACAKGYGCVRQYGVSLCARFCQPAAARGDAVCVDEASGLGGLCLAALPDRLDIGVCVYACDPVLREAPAPGAPACGLVSDLDYPVWRAAGDAGRGERCGPDRACRAGDLCVERGAGGVCRRAADPVTGRCDESGDGPADRVRRLAPSSTYAVCTPCAVVAGALDAADPTGAYEICFAVLDQAAAAEACARDGAALLSLADATRAERLAWAAESETGDEMLWTAAARDEETGEWLWPDGSAVDAGLWRRAPAADDPPCARLSPVDARLVPTACDVEAHPTCVIGEGGDR